MSGSGAARVWLGVPRKDLGLANIIPVAGTGAGWGLVVVVVTFVHVLSIPCKRQGGLARGLSPIILQGL